MADNQPIDSRGFRIILCTDQFRGEKLSDCCSSSDGDDDLAKRLPCPVDGRPCAEVSIRTIAHHIRDAWDWSPTAKRYFFCDHPSCEIVYFGDDGSILLETQLRTRVGVKGASGDDLLCYCFGISKADFSRDPAIKDFVVAQTRAGLCACDSHNPSGRCCLKAFSKVGRAGPDQSAKAREP